MQRQFRRKILEKPRLDDQWVEPGTGDHHFIRWPNIEDATLLCAEFRYLVDQKFPPFPQDRIFLERRHLHFFQKPSGNLDVQVEIAPKDRTFAWGDEQAWTHYGLMIQYSLPNLIKGVSRDLSTTMTRQQREVDALLQPYGSWRFDGPDPKSFLGLGGRIIRDYDPHLFRMSVSLQPENLRNGSVEELLSSFIDHHFYFARPASPANVKLTYETQP